MAQYTLDLSAPERPAFQSLGVGAALLAGFARSREAELRACITDIAARAPFRHMETPGGHRMSVAMTNCGALGWVTSQAGYRYAALDPERGAPWPELPAAFLDLAGAAAERLGFKSFTPNACLINRYQPGARMTLHQDKNEQDFSHPIVSVSLGLPATFLFGGLERSERPTRVPLVHGDVVVWGGPARLRFHGVLPVKDGHHPTLGNVRLNLTFRRVG